jgi:hypothetical protein
MASTTFKSAALAASLLLAALQTASAAANGRANDGPIDNGASIGNGPTIEGPGANNRDTTSSINGLPNTAPPLDPPIPAGGPEPGQGGTPARGN